MLLFLCLNLQKTVFTCFTLLRDIEQKIDNSVDVISAPGIFLNSQSSTVRDETALLSYVVSSNCIKSQFFCIVCHQETDGERTPAAYSLQPVALLLVFFFLLL